ncbi:MAG: DUF4349 domain-containing protein [Rubrobacteraceae bacterium]
MADREHTPARDLDRELRELGDRIEYPTTPDFSQQVRQSIEANAEEQPERQNITWLPILSPKWAAAAAVLLLVLAVPIFSPGVRDTLSNTFTVGAGGVGESGGADVASDQAAGSAAQSSRAQSQGATPSGNDMPSSGGGSAASAEGNFDRKVIKTAELGIQSEDVRGSAEEAQRIATQLGGNVLSSQVDRGGGSVKADLTLSVPSQEFEKALEELRALGKKVTTDAVEGEDVTEEFVDLESRERNLLATEESLLKLYDESEDVNDTLSIQRELTNVRGEIERVQGRMQYLEQRSETSRINLSIQPVEKPAAPPQGWSPTSTISEAWNASLGFLQVIATAFLSVAVFSWWLVPILLLGFAWWRTSNRPQEPDATESSGP